MGLRAGAHHQQTARPHDLGVVALLIKTQLYFIKIIPTVLPAAKAQQKLFFSLPSMLAEKGFIAYRCGLLVAFSCRSHKTFWCGDDVLGSTRVIHQPSQRFII